MTTSAPPDPPAVALVKKLRYDLTAMQAKVTDLLNELGRLELNVKPGAECPHCGLPFRGPNTLAEHLYTSHAGPLPQHWTSVDASVAAEQLHHDREQEAA